MIRGGRSLPVLAAANQAGVALAYQASGDETVSLTIGAHRLEGAVAICRFLLGSPASTKADELLELATDVIDGGEAAPAALAALETKDLAGAEADSTMAALVLAACLHGRPDLGPRTSAFTKAMAGKSAALQQALTGGSSGGSSSSSRLAAIKSRIEKLEAHVAKTNPISWGVLRACEAAGARSAKVVQAPGDYYSWTLQQRARFLGTAPPHLCKTVVMENVWWNGGGPGGGSGDAPNAAAVAVDPLTAPPPPLHNARYYAVIVQYVAKLDVAKMSKVVRGMWPASAGQCPSNKAFKFQVAQGDASLRLTGYAHNGVTVYGMRCGAERMPVIVDAAILNLDPPQIFLGGGDKDLKLRVDTGELVQSLGAGPGKAAITASVSNPRGEGDDGADGL
eukprot:g2149.t1